MGVSGAALVVRSLEQRGVPRATVMSSVAVDVASFYIAYVIDLVIALVLLATEGRAQPLIVVIAVLFLLYGSTLATVLLSLSGRTKTRRTEWLRRIPALGRVVAILQEATPSLARDPGLLARATLLQMLIAALDAATLWVLVRSLGIDASVAAVYASFMIASVMRSIGFLPGGLGTFEAASVGALSVAGVPIAAGLSATLLFRGLSFWLPMIPGLALSRSLTGAAPTAGRIPARPRRRLLVARPSRGRHPAGILGGRPDVRRGGSTPGTHRPQRRR